MNVLLIEDDQSISLALMQALSNIYNVDHVTNGEIGISKTTMHNYACVLLDLSLPGMQGLQVCRALRGNGYKGPIIILTGQVKIINKIKLLDAGADDYITKPFSVGELKARIRSLVRRADIQSSGATQLAIDDLILDFDRHTVTRAQKVIKLRRKEFALLECLMQHAGIVVTREKLGSYAWHSSEDPWTNTIDVHIKYLRDKIDRPFDHQLIKTVHGLGYKLVVPRKSLGSIIMKEKI